MHIFTGNLISSKTVEITTNKTNMTAKLIQEINAIHPVGFLTHLVDDDEAIVMLVKELLALNGISNLINLEEFKEGKAYEEYMKSHPDVLPNLCLFDYLFEDRSIDGIGLTISTMKRNPDCKVIMISGVKDWQVLQAFQDAGGYRWVDKDHKHFKSIFIDRVQSAIEEIKKILMTRHMLDKIEVPVLTERQPLSKTNESDTGDNSY